MQDTKAQIESVIIGKSEAVQLALAAFLAKGHILLDDVPGTGKTTLAKTIAITLGCDFKRIQFTPDLMPSDITGMNFYNPQNGEFEFRPGPVLTNVLLADEINRTTPRTQSALLETMEERQITVDSITRKLPQPFLVLATQNPIDSEGTFPLPYAQRDRFLLRIKLGYPDPAEEIKIISKHAFTDTLGSLKAILNSSQLLQIQELISSVYLADELVQYILEIVAYTRNHEAVELPLSPRASIGMVRAAKALAFLQGRAYVLPDDIKVLVNPVFAHRLKLKKAEEYKGLSTDDFLQELLAKIPIPLKGSFVTHEKL
ncbi:MAG: MoxR family ATPase [Firmicutes bacterium]|nr:MoxR family ATPase [Bacillota bacterium]